MGILGFLVRLRSQLGRIIRAGACWIVPTLLLAGSNMPTHAAIPEEYQVKAIFLFNFAQFVDWPSNALADGQSPLVIGVLGQDPFGSYLDETVRGEKVNNRQVVVERYRRVEEIKSCNVLFISRSEAERLESILASLKGRSILTVGDFDGFSRRGGMVRFVLEKNKIRLKITLEAAKAANVTISSKLLRPAEILAPGKD